MNFSVLFQKQWWRQHAPLILVSVILIIIGGTIILQSPWIKEPGSPIIATVNGAQVTQFDVEVVQQALEDELGEDVSFSVALGQTINEVLLLQEAQRRGIKITEEDLLEAFGSSYSTAPTVSQQRYARQLALQRLTETITAITITEEQARTFFENNREAIGASDKVTYDQVSTSVKALMIQIAQEQLLTGLVAQLHQGAKISVTLAFADIPQNLSPSPITSS